VPAVMGACASCDGCVAAAVGRSKDADLVNLGNGRKPWGCVWGHNEKVG